MHADFDLGADGVTELPPGFRRGPYMPRGGRTPGYSPKKAAEMARRIDAGGEVGDEDLESSDGQLSLTTRHLLAKARKEAALAGLNELQLKVKTGEYLPRAAYREATATLVASLSQGLRSLPDTLERKFGLPPEVLQDIEAAIDESLNSIADELALFTEAKP